MTATHLLLIVVVLIAGQTPPAQTPGATDDAVAEQAGYVAEVAGNDVYVRSGPSRNYYPVTKLNAGARVRVVGQEGDWLAVIPPEGCFSLISDTYVDVDSERHGVVNGDSVRVRAGSLIDPRQHYALQLKLSRGAEVRIVGHLEILDPEGQGYYKIVPPSGVKLWMSARYVERVPAKLLALEAASQAEPPGVETGQSEAAPATGTEERAELTATVTPVTPEQIQEHRRRILELDAELQDELDKPLLRRDLDRFCEAFESLAEQAVDSFSRAYANARIEQITDLQEMIEAVRQVRELREQVKTARTDALAQRAGIRPKPLPIGQGFDAQGELRPSVVYDSPAGPKRFRLVDPTKSPVRTIGYVEIPRGSEIRPDDFLGRLVGIRAREIKLETGNVDPISIFVAAEIVPLD